MVIRMKKNGFTLVELLAVIVILGMLATLVTTNVVKYINSSKEQTNKLALNNLKDAAITYGLDKLNIAKACALTSIPDSYNPSYPNGCAANLISVKDLKDAGYFTDDKKVCSETGQILIYRYHDVTYDTYEIKVYIADSVCEGNQ
jgi:prepilin-type N-terminal cleavage/methylation domain-containing protein